MFITYDAYKAKGWEDYEGTAWSVVERYGHTPWFQVSYMATPPHQQRFTSVLLARDVHALAHILTLQDDNAHVISVQVVLPSWMTGKPAWSMQQLIEVKCLHDNDGVPVMRYLVEGGQSYFESTSEAVLTSFSGHSHVIYRDASVSQSQAGERLAWT